MMKKGSLGAALLMATAFFFESAAAHASYKFCNETSYVLMSAIGMESGGGSMESQGWFRLYPGFCTEILAELEKGQRYYVYARSVGAYRGAPKIFGGNETLCISLKENDRFHITDTIPCREHGYEKTGFLPVHIAGGSKRSTFSEQRTYPTRRHMMVAGTQRLLNENGFDVGEIDGYAGQTTLRAIKEFQKAHEIRVTGVISQYLFDNLVRVAKSRVAEKGMWLCNKTKHILWSAFGHKTFGPKSEYESMGWIKLPPDGCRRVLHERLGRDIYYAYAEVIDEGGVLAREKGRDLLWAGDFPMCVHRTLFRIRGRADCEKRKYREVHFRKIETGGVPSWTETFGELAELQDRGQEEAP